MAKRRINGKAAAFPCHNVELSLAPVGDQYIGQCFICDKEDHLYVAPESGQWECKKCWEKGNIFTFLRHVHAKALAETTRSDYARLSIEKSLPQNILRVHGAAALSTGDWLLPAHATTGGIVNLYRWNCDTNEIFGTWGLPASLLNIHNLRSDNQRPVCICEGQWDTYALDFCLRETGRTDDFDVLGLPGATAFKESWRRLLSKRDVILFYDNDEAGRKGTDRTYKILSQSPSPPNSIRVLNWPEGTPEGYDVRDVLTKGIP
jgi:hypothetical protein